MSTDSEDLRTLSNEPTIEQIQEITKNFLSKEHELKVHLQYINTYILHILPIYSSLRNALQLEVRKVFYSTVGISNLVNQYKLSKNEIYLKVMKDILLDPTLLKTVIDKAKNNRLELNQIKSLFFGSKIFNAFEGKLFIDKYLELLAKQLIEVCKEGKEDVDYFIQFLTIHTIESKVKLFHEFFDNSNFNLLKRAFSQMNNLQKRQFYIKNLLPYLETLINPKNRDTIINILQHFDIETIEPLVASYLGEINNIELQQAVTYHFKHNVEDFTSLLKLWGDEQYIKDASEAEQENLTKQLLIIINFIPKSDLKLISVDRDFLNSITSRLSTNDSRKRDFGMMIAKVVTNHEIKFQIEDEIIIEELSKVSLTRNIDFTDLLLESGMKDLSISNRKVTILNDSDDDSDEDDEDDDYDSRDEAEPVFLKDLIVKLNSDKTRSISKLLSHTIKLVRRKATFKLEIEFYSEELVSILVGLLNKLNEQKFEELKLNAIVSVIVVNPAVISHVMKLLFIGDYSLQQRMVILSSISLSARELRGFDDEYIEKPKADFPTCEIGSRKKLVEEVTTPRFEEIKDDDDKQQHTLGQGKVTRISSKLTKPKTKKKPNNFSKIAHKFFYPLANAWAEGINLGHYNEMFMKHYLTTLELIVNAAYPSHDFENMAEVYTEIKNNSSNIVI